jgi:hypothetical protein
VEWDFTVDLGIDLGEMPPGSFTVECDEDGRVCRWHVPDPTSRPVSVRTETMVVSVDGAALVSAKVEQKNAQTLVSRVAELTEANVRSETFWSLARENVRSSLGTIAREHLTAAVLDSGEAPPVIQIVFASEETKDRAPGLRAPTVSGDP